MGSNLSELGGACFTFKRVDLHTVRVGSHAAVVEFHVTASSLAFAPQVLRLSALSQHFRTTIGNSDINTRSH